MSAGYCFNGCDCDACVNTVAGECGCFTNSWPYHFAGAVVGR